MKRLSSFRPSTARCTSLAAAVALVLSHAAHAGTATWQNIGTDFNTGANWAGGLGPGGIPDLTDNATFSAVAPAFQPDLSAPLTIQGLTFSTATGGWTLASANNSLLTLTNVGTTTSSAINASNISGTDTISAGLVLGEAAASTATFTQTRGGTLILSGNISSTNAIAGLSFASNGATGTTTFTLSGNNTYAGTTTVMTNEQVNINSSNAISTGTLVFNGNATIENTSTTPALTLQNNNILLSNGSLTYGSAATTSSLNFGTGSVAMSGANRTMTINGGTVTISSVAPDASNTTRSLTKAGGGGTLIITGAAGANFGGGLGVTAGTLIIGNKAAGGTGTFTLGGGTLQASVDMSGAANRIANSFSLSGTTIISGANNIELGGKLTGASGGNRTLTNSLSTGPLIINDIDLSNDATTTRTLTINGATNTVINGVVANGSALQNTLIIANTGTTTLNNGGNTQSATTMNAGNGTLVLNNRLALGSGTFNATAGSLLAGGDYSGANRITNPVSLSSLTLVGSNSIEFGGKVTGLTGGNRTFTNNLNGGVFTLNDVDINTQAGTARTFTLTGVGTTIVKGSIADGTGATTPNTVVIQGSTGSSQTLSGAGSTYSGGTTLSTAAATLAIGADSTPSAPGSTVTSGPLGTGGLTFTAGTLISSGGAHTIANAIPSFTGVTIGGNADLTLNGPVQWTGTGTTTFNVNNTGTTTFGGTFNMRNGTGATPNGDRTVTVQGAGNLVMSGALVNGFSINARWAINTTGITTFSGNNTFSGSTTVGNGTTATTLKIGHANALGFGGFGNVASITTVSNGSTLDLNGQTVPAESIAINGAGVGTNGALINSNPSLPAVIGSGVSALSIAGGASGGGLGYSTVPSVTVSGTGTGATAVATLGLTNASFTLNFGDKVYTTAPAVTISGGGGQGAAATAVLSGGTAGTVIGILIQDGSGGPAADSRGTGYTTAPTIAFSGGVATSGTIDPSGVGNANNFQVVALQMTSPGTGYFGFPTVTIDAGTSTQPASATALGSGLVTNGSTIGGAGDITVNGQLSGTGLTKSGNGKLVLAADNSGYFGQTTINAGTVLVSGSIAGSSTTVNNTATLGGTGTIGSVEVGATAILRGGDGVNASGALTSSNLLTLDDGATIALTLGPGGAHSSLACVGGFWSFDPTSQGFLFNSGAPAGTYDNIISGLSGTELGLDDIANWTVLNPGLTGTFSYDGNGGVDLVLVPEPGTTAALLSGLGLLLGLRRRRA